MLCAIRSYDLRRPLIRRSAAYKLSNQSRSVGRERIADNFVEQLVMFVVTLHAAAAAAAAARANVVAARGVVASRRDVHIKLAM